MKDKAKFLRCRHHPKGGLAKLQPREPQDRSTWSCFDSPEKVLANIFIQLDFSNHSENIHNGVREEIIYKLAQPLTFQIYESHLTES